MREPVRDAAWAALVFLLVLLCAAAAGCQPIRVAGPPQSRLWQLFVCVVVGAIFVGALLQVPLAVRENRGREAEDREIERIRAELQHQAHASEPPTPLPAAPAA